MAKDDLSVKERVVTVIGEGIESVIASAIKLIPGEEKRTARHTVLYLQKKIPSAFEYICSSIINGNNPADFGIDTSVVYDAFRNEWEKNHKSKFPEYKK